MSGIIGHSKRKEEEAKAFDDFQDRKRAEESQREQARFAENHIFIPRALQIFKDSGILAYTKYVGRNGTLHIADKKNGLELGGLNLVIREDRVEYERSSGQPYLDPPYRQDFDALAFEYLTDENGRTFNKYHIGVDRNGMVLINSALGLQELSPTEYLNETTLSTYIENAVRNPIRGKYYIGDLNRYDVL